MKRFTTLGIIGVSLLGISGAALASEPADSPFNPPTQPTLSGTILGVDAPLTFLEKESLVSLAKAEADRLATERRTEVEQAYQEHLVSNQVLVETTVGDLLDRVGKTPYIFGAATPNGWDCSGLVVWAYSQLGIDLPHSASKQADFGRPVDSPEVGDVVLFGNSSGIFHSAIYVGDNKVVHAGFKEGRYTEVISLDSPSFEGTEISFRHFIDLP